MDDFLALLALAFGTDVTLTAMVWGSVRVILTLASTAGDTLRTVLNMLEDLSKTLPRLGAYGDTLPLGSELENALVDVYTEVICFYARTIHFFTTLAYASAIDLAGLIDLDLCRFTQALGAFEQALEIRRARLGPDDAFIASSLNNLALVYTELGGDNLETAHALHMQAVDIRLRTSSDRIGNSYSNLASLLLCMGRADEAEETLAHCPSLKDFTDETFLRTGNPRFSGDMVLLSRIRLRQGRVDDALRLASKALAFRQTLLGNRLKTCDSLYDVASILHLQNRGQAAIEALNQLVDIAGTLSEGEGQLARALYKLSVLHSESGAQEEAQGAKAKALEIRDRLQPWNKEAAFVEESFSKLVPWMLW
ncbi:hypothetical protein F5Y17DRAFT_406788 [Xylariaceae sp. FL0594]|nr:hypothetical protein F5Y17DRAFT_406788 [Xylariaceae sp. FL0594]